MERQEVLGEIIASLLPVARACKAVGVGRASYYRWRHKGTEAKKRGSSWNSMSDQERQKILEVSEEHPEWSSRQIGFHLTDLGHFSVSESTVYRVLKRAGKIPLRPKERRCAGKEYLEKPRSVHEQWQVDFTDFFIPAWGRYHDGGVLDDRSRFLLHHDLRPYERTEDAIEVLDGAVEFAQGTHGYAARRVVSDHGKCFEARDTRSYLGLMNIRPIYARAHHPQTLGKLERLHRSMKDQVNLDVYDHPWELSKAIDDFYHFYNYERYHEALGNLTPADIYFGKAEGVLARRKELKEKTMMERRKRYEAWKLKKDLTSELVSASQNVGPEPEKNVSFQTPKSVSLG